MALTSTTGTVISSEVTFDIGDLQGGSRGDDIVLYMDYTKGGSDTLTFEILFQDSGINSNFYNRITISSSVVTKDVISVTATGKYKIPLNHNKNEDVIKIAISGLVDGDLNVEFVVSQPYI